MNTPSSVPRRQQTTSPQRRHAQSIRAQHDPDRPLRRGAQQPQTPQAQAPPSHPQHAPHGSCPCEVMWLRHRVTVAIAMMRLTIPKNETGTSDELSTGLAKDTAGSAPELCVSNQHSWYRPCLDRLRSVASWRSASSCVENSPSRPVRATTGIVPCPPPCFTSLKLSGADTALSRGKEPPMRSAIW